jgi:ring-1,2-phenylacetyl-CoA epoxidase subunit PaaB
MEARQKAWDDGAWVRDGLMAHAEKKRARAARNEGGSDFLQKVWPEFSKTPQRRWPMGGHTMTSSTEWPLWEVFIRGQHGISHRHVGSLHAPDAEMAMKNARDVYTRRNEGVSIWVVEARHITASVAVGQGPALRAVAIQGLPPPQFLRHPRRSGAHVMEDFDRRCLRLEFLCGWGTTR